MAETQGDVFLLFFVALNPIARDRRLHVKEQKSPDTR
jgi:hypothetical protein